MKNWIAAFAMLTAVIAPAAWCNESAKVYIIYPANGETVKSPVTIKFGLKGMGVVPAGIAKANTVHHHLLINLK